MKKSILLLALLLYGCGDTAPPNRYTEKQRAVQKRAANRIKVSDKGQIILLTPNQIGYNVGGINVFTYKGHEYIYVYHAGLLHSASCTNDNTVELSNYGIIGGGK